MATLVNDVFAFTTNGGSNGQQQTSLLNPTLIADAIVSKFQTTTSVPVTKPGRSMLARGQCWHSSLCWQIDHRLLSVV